LRERVRACAIYRSRRSSASRPAGPHHLSGASYRPSTARPPTQETLDSFHDSDDLAVILHSSRLFTNRRRAASKLTPSGRGRWWTSTNRLDSRSSAETSALLGEACGLARRRSVSRWRRRMLSPTARCILRSSESPSWRETGRSMFSSEAIRRRCGLVRGGVRCCRTSVPACDQEISRCRGGI
jgi:hypothetical protein